MKPLLALAALMLGTAAQAQTTTCESRILGSPQYGVVCKTRPAEPASPTSCAGSVFSQSLLGGCSPSEVKAANKRVADQKAIGAMLAEGKCDEAVVTALRSGDLVLAQHVRGFCPAPAR